MKIFLKIMSWTVMSFFILLAVGMVGVRIFGFTPYAVVSGSMEPTYMTGSLVFVKDVTPQSIETGDSISFVLDENLTVVTHRVIGISDDGQYFYTKGDANETADPNPVYYKNLIGKVSFSLPFLGYFSIWITSFYGKILCISLLCGLTLYAIVRKILKYKNKTQTSETAVPSA